MMCSRPVDAGEGRVRTIKVGPHWPCDNARIAIDLRANGVEAVTTRFVG
jgi:hypothetical protein